MCAREIDLSLPVPHLSVYDRMLSFVNKKPKLRYLLCLLLPKMVRFHQVVSWCYPPPPIYPPPLPSHTNYSFHNAGICRWCISRPHPSIVPSQLFLLILSMSFVVLCCRNLSSLPVFWKATFSHLFLLHYCSHFVLLPPCAGLHIVLLHLDVMRFLARRFLNFLFILLLTKIQKCVWS